MTNKLTSVQNPFRARRHSLGYSIEQVAFRAQVSRGTFDDLEVGLYRKPPPSALRALASSESDADRLVSDYYHWVSLRRKENSLVFFEYDVKSFTEYCDKIAGSLRGFCRALVVQRSLVQDYVRQGNNWDYIENCLWEVGLSGEFTEYLRGVSREGN